MRIWIVTQFYPPEFGAAAVRLSRLARLLVKDGHNVTVITGMPNYPEGVIKPPYKGKLTYNEAIDGVDVRRVWLYTSPSKSNKARILNQLSLMVTAALRGTFLRRPDVILVESHPLFMCIAGGWLKRVKRAPMILNVSDLWPESAVATGALRADSALVKYASKVERWAYGDARHLVAMTQGVRDGILAVYPHAEKVTLIQNAVDLDVFRPHLTNERAQVRAKYHLPADRFVVAHIGNMSLTYDFDIMIDAAAAMPDATFLFAGGGSKAAYVEQQVRERGLTNVIFTGVLPHTDMPAIWNAADACIIALRDHSVAGGTLPAKMYEALATGTPIAAAIRGEGAAMIERAKAGIIVPIGDSSAMVAALRRFVDDPAERAQFAANARAFAEANLSPERVKDAYFILFKDASR